MEFLRDISRRHEELKKRIHGFRLPLSSGWRNVATCVYISIPIVSGYFIMQAAIAQSVKNLGPRGEKLDAATASLKTTTSAAPGSVNAAVADQKRALQMVLDRHKHAKEQQQEKQQQSK